MKAKTSSGSLVAFIAGLAALVFQYLQSVPADPDLWGHTRFGLDHIQTGHLARTDPFSFMTSGQEWINHEWLTELIFGWVFMAGGTTGLFLFRAAIFSAIVALLFGMCWSSWKNGFVLLLLAAGVLPLLAVFTNVRPHSFTFLFLLLALFCIEAYGRGRTVWINCLPILMVLWVNLHGGFVVGLGLSGLGLALLFFGAEGSGTIPSCRARRHLVAVGTLTVAATLCNPYHVGLYTYLVKALALPREHVTEWMTLGGVQLVPYLLLTALPGAMFLAARSVKHPTRSILFLVTVVAAFVNARFLALLIMFGTLVIVDQGGVVWRRVTDGSRHPLLARVGSTRAVAVLAVLVALVSLPQAFDDLRHYRGRVWVDPDGYPVNAARFLKTHALGRNLALPFHWGEYAIWHLYPDYLVSPDGRYETVYPPVYVDSLLSAYYMGDLERFIEGQDVDVLLLESGEALDRGAGASQEWRELYRDQTATVYVSHERLPAVASNPSDSTASIMSRTSEPVFFP